MNLRAVRALAITLLLNGSPHTITSLTTVRDHGRDVTMFVENGALVVCSGWLTRFSFEGANISASVCRPDLIAYRGFEK